MGFKGFPSASNARTDGIPMLHLRIISGASKGRTVSMAGANLAVTIGRDPSNRIELVHTAVSRFHCIVSAEGDEYYVEDLGSTNGTYLNGRRVTKHRLSPGDELIVANAAIVVEASPASIHDHVGPLDLSVSIAPRGDTPGPALSRSVEGMGEGELLAGLAGDRDSRAYRALEVLIKADRAFRDIEEFKALLDNLLDLIMESVPASRGYIFLVQRDTGALVPYARRPVGETGDDGEIVISQTIVRTAVREKSSIISSDALLDERFVHSQSLADFSVRSAMCTPLINRGQVLGIAYVDSPAKEAFGAEDLTLFSAMALKAGVAIDNARLYDDMRSLFYNTVETLVRTIQAKDPYTSGHSTRVSRYSLLIAEKLGLSTREKHQTYLASMLHDIGKIGIPDDLLNRPGKLSEEEMEQVRGHVEVGASMLEMLGEMHPIVPLIRHHHEAYDGSGYPDGLRGEEIPLISRIVAVADIYDAMTSDRPYRTRRTHQDSIEEIRRVTGTKLDPRVVGAFIQVLSEIAPAPSTGAPRAEAPTAAPAR
jgi:putative nucleotidyltransferase with HDIG domain